MDLYFARQPILDIQMKVYGYELLFRPGPQAKKSFEGTIFDGDSASRNVLNAVSWGGFENITNGTYAFINFTESLLLNETASLFSKEFLIIEVLESVKPTKDVLDAIQRLKRAGYKIALDDYLLDHGTESLLSYADIVKIDIDGTPESYENLTHVKQRVNLSRCKLLAEKVETYEVFHKTKELGCTLFQGYFFAKPTLQTETVINPTKLTKIRLMNEFMKPMIDFMDLADIIKKDVSLTVKTLRLVNSAYFGRKNEIKSISQAIILLGEKELKRWLIFSVLQSFIDDKPSELTTMSLIRGFFCERIIVEMGQDNINDPFFFIGLLSLLDVLTNMSMEDCLSNILLPAETKEALLEHRGPGWDVLKLVSYLERGLWQEASELCDGIGLDIEHVAKIYLSSITAAQNYMG